MCDPAHEVRVRPITRGPRHHWFGYYDKLEFDPSGRFVLGMAIDFEGRSPTQVDAIGIGMVDLEDDDRWIALGESRAWCWQQGCMLQWRPGSRDEVIWNDREGDRFVSHVLNVRTGSKRTLPVAAYALSPDGRNAVTLDFARVNDMRPGYGYVGLPDRNGDVSAPDDSGIWRLDTVTGRATLLVTLAQVAAIPFVHADLTGAKHYFNHLLVNPAGTRFAFLHRWRYGDGPFYTRMLTASLDGSDIRVVDVCGHTSHFCWRDADHVLAFTRPAGGRPGFYLFDVETGVSELVIDDGVDGHCLYLPGSECILNDTYPAGERREQEVYLFHVASGVRRSLGRYPSPASYAGEWRCDLHPRVGPSGGTVVVDSAHGGDGRQVFLLDIGSMVGAAADFPARGEGEC